MSRFAKFAWFNVGYTILVILWGAVVRATGSGAGCGNHWPTCNGDVIPRPEQIETMIEFSHRLTSGLAGIFVLVLLIWAFRKVFTHNQQLIRRMAVLTFVFILVEGALGAALVRFELVADNASVARAVVVGLHLMNTLVLLGFATLTAWAASLKRSVTEIHMTRYSLYMLIGIITMIVISAIGAVTALGDTLFPAENLLHGIRQDMDPTANFLIQLRIWHPILAILTSAYLYWASYQILTHFNERSETLRRLIYLLLGVVGLQVAGGFLNVILLAPVWMQIVHLLLADLLWVVLIILTASLLYTKPTFSMVS